MDSFPIPQLNLPTLNGITPPDMPNLAKSTFESGPKDDIATADVYKITSSVDAAESQVITSIQELNLQVNQAILDMKLSAGQAAEFLSKVKGDIKINVDQLTDRLIGTNSEFRSMYDGLNDKLKQGAILKTYAQQQASKLVCTINDTKSMVDSANIKDIRSLGSFINKYTGSNIFSGKDKGAISGLLGSVITTASDLGITGAFKSIAETVNDNGILGRITRSVLPIALRNSDSTLLRDLSSSTAGKLIDVFSPGFTSSFSRAFVYRGDRGGRLNSFEDIFHSFENINDAWDIIERGDGSSALNLLSLVGGSKDFSDLVMTGVRYWTTEQSNGNNAPVRVQPAMGLASLYREITVGDAIKRDFPNVALLSQYNDKLPKQGGQPAGTRNANNLNVVDARLIRGSVGALLGF